MDRIEMDYILRYLLEKVFPSSFKNDSKKKKIFRRKCQNFVQKNGVLYYNHLKNGLLRVVSKEEKNDLIRKVHEQPTGHTGETRTWRQLSTGYYWLGIVKDVASFIQQCQVCQANQGYRKINYLARTSANIEIDVDNQGNLKKCLFSFHFLYKLLQ